MREYQCGVSSVKIIFVQLPPDKRQPYHSQWQWQLGLSNWKLCVLLLQFLINFKRFAGAEAAAGQGGGRSKGSRVAAALLAADLWQWQIKPMGVATTLLLLLPSSICVCVCARHGKRQKSVARFRQTFVIKATATGTAPDAPRQP